ARYSVDAIWLVPHFEKMLYDNAQILELLAFAHAARPNPLFAQRAEETVEWLERDMLAAEDGAAFASSLDADSEGEEGRFYVWSAEEVDALLGQESPIFSETYDVDAAGNWEGSTILNRRQQPEMLGEAHEAMLARHRATLFEARAKRIPPGRDGKVLADWNGLTIAALVRASAVFGRPEWLGSARRAFDTVAERMAAPDGRLMHALRQGEVSAAGLLEDHAAMARAALALFEATGEDGFLRRALGWAEAVEHHFAAAAPAPAENGGGYFTSADDANDVPVRGRTAGDNATPSGNGLVAEVQARLFHLTGDDRWRRAAESTIGAFAGSGNALAAMPTLLAASDLLTEAASVAVAGPPGEAATEALVRAVLTHPDPALVLLRAPDPAALPPDHPASGKGTAEGAAAAAYVCRRGVCSLPVTDPAALSASLARPAVPPAAAA
ncbi:MAG TPA: thioredoxin domain-containing protein, partial [Acetobacteraceae bacterium]|nr:thioredoxin domain-containing protein [Acetobacteraceae bacterium]